MQAQDRGFTMQSSQDSAGVSIHFFVCKFVRRSIIAACALILFLSLSPRSAFGGMTPILLLSGNDNISVEDFNDIIDNYNTVNMTSLPNIVGLLTKTDDDKVDEDPPGTFEDDYFSLFDFYESDGVTPIGSLMDLENAFDTGDKSVFFEFTGMESLLYYTVKGGNNYRLFQYMPGMLNFAEAPVNPSGGPAGISHISFWIGPTPPGSSVPELGTWSMTMAALAIGSMISAKRRRKAIA
jgi:hypothetical protein